MAKALSLLQTDDNHLATSTCRECFPFLHQQTWNLSKILHDQIFSANNLTFCCENVVYTLWAKKWKFCVACWLRSLFRPVLHSIILNLIIFLCKWRDIRKFSCCIFWKRSKVFRIHFFWKWWETRKEAISQIYIIAESTNPWSFCQTSAINKDLSTFTFRMINKGAFFPQTIA